MPVLIYAFYRVNTHYKNVAEQLRLEDGAQLHEFDGNTVIVLVGERNQGKCRRLELCAFHW